METLDEFYRVIQAERKSLGISKSRPWYRGHTHSEFRLLPSLLRHEKGHERERNLYARFRTRAGRLLPFGSTSWEILAVMQHHRVPTRLLDWTESLHVAIYFALLGDPQSPCIWLLNPYHLNRDVTGNRTVFDAADTIRHDYYESICIARNWPHDRPIAMRPPWTNERVIAQHSLFTLHGNLTDPLETSCPEHIRRVEIPLLLRQQLHQELDLGAIDHFRLFPDLDGLARSLTESAFHPPPDDH